VNGNDGRLAEAARRTADAAAPAGARPSHRSRGRWNKPAFTEPLIYPSAEVARSAASSTDQICVQQWLKVGVRLVHMNNMSGMLGGSRIR
jgi:hypothetical protein